MYLYTVKFFYFSILYTNEISLLFIWVLLASRSQYSNLSIFAFPCISSPTLFYKPACLSENERPNQFHFF